MIICVVYNIRNHIHLSSRARLFMHIDYDNFPVLPLIFVSVYFREVDLLDWDNLMDMNTQMGRHLVVPNVKVGSWSCSINSILIPKVRTHRDHI